MIRESESKIWQVLTGRESNPSLQSWHESKEAALREVSDCERAWPNRKFWLEQGTEHITPKCRCGSVHAEEQTDFYGISTGYWCDDCYETDYPYRKDGYFDPDFAGERMDDDY